MHDDEKGQDARSSKTSDLTYLEFLHLLVDLFGVNASASTDGVDFFHLLVQNISQWVQLVKEVSEKVDHHLQTILCRPSKNSKTISPSISEKRSPEKRKSNKTSQDRFSASSHGKNSNEVLKKMRPIESPSLK